VPQLIDTEVLLCQRGLEPFDFFDGHLGRFERVEPL
jgi:hypothetical protein